MSASQHQQDIHTVIYLEKLIYAHDGIVAERDIVSADINLNTPTEAERLRVLALYDDSNDNPHYRHWQRRVFGDGTAYLCHPAPFEPF